MTRDWLPYAFSYRDGIKGCNGLVMGVGWRRWCLLIYFRGAYCSPRRRLMWCNYYGADDGG